ncbi:hypothetical protein TPA0905_45060 [Streptomyces olivaceus]|nr:hypothetical protein TPA0905_45060 [Streptomyces olivaceus]
MQGPFIARAPDRAPADRVYHARRAPRGHGRGRTYQPYPAHRPATRRNVPPEPVGERDRNPPGNASGTPPAAAVD